MSNNPYSEWKDGVIYKALGVPACKIKLLNNEALQEMLRNEDIGKDVDLMMWFTTSRYDNCPIAVFVPRQAEEWAPHNTELKLNWIKIEYNIRQKLREDEEKS